VHVENSWNNTVAISLCSVWAKCDNIPLIRMQLSTRITNCQLLNCTIQESNSIEFRFGSEADRRPIKHPMKAWEKRRLSSSPVTEPLLDTAANSLLALFLRRCRPPPNGIFPEIPYGTPTATNIHRILLIPELLHIYFQFPRSTVKCHQCMRVQSLVSRTLQSTDSLRFSRYAPFVRRLHYNVHSTKTSTTASLTKLPERAYSLTSYPTSIPSTGPHRI
jgi:hypothetical protein